MCEPVVCEHIPKTATARNKATITGRKEVCWPKKFSIFSRKWAGRVTGNMIFFGVALS